MTQIDYIIGDSIAAGVAINAFKLKRSGKYGEKSIDDKGISKVGASPAEVLGYLNEIGKEKLKSKNIILSGGISNNTAALDKVKEQLKFLKDLEAKVFLIGVSDTPPAKIAGLVGMNPKLEALAKEFGFKFLGGFKPSTDGIHPPSYDKYYASNIKPVLDATPDEKPVEKSDEKPVEKSDEKPDEKQDEVVVVPPKPINPLSIIGKFSLKVKSGPGVIIGITDVDIVDGKADFEGIQFDQAGDYVVSISSSSPDIDPLDIKITVLPEQDVIPQDSKGEPDKEAAGDRPIIAQIDPPTLPIYAMQFNTEGVATIDTVTVAESMGNLPLFNYHGSIINHKDIQTMRLYHDGIVPKVKILFNDTNEVMSENPPQDDTTFEIFIKSWSNNLKSPHLVFKIEDHKKLENKLYSITGTIDLSELYRMKFKVYKGTSFNVIREICKDLKIGFNSNIENTADEMPWRNIGDRPHKFLGEIIKHSYISDESFMAGYIDFYYCFNYVDIEKEMKRDISKDVGIDTGDMGGPPKLDTEKIAPMRFMSEKGLQSSSFYFIKTSQQNDSTKISLEQGYKTRTKFYDKVKKMFLVFDVDATTSDGSKGIILKGAEGDKESFDNNIVTKYAGKIDTDNVHKNYNYAETQNRINLDNMVKNRMNIILPNPNYNIYMYQKIDVYIVKEGATILSPELIEYRYSGEWLILDIVFEYSGGKMFQDVTLVRKEMGKNRDEMANPDKLEAKPDTKDQKNENPLTEKPSENITNKPNEVYKVDEVYTVQDINGKKFIITIKKISENGTEVVAEVRDIDYIAKQSNPEGIDGVTKTEEAPQSPEAIPPDNKSTDQYTIAVENAVSDNDKKVTGTITLKKTGPKTGATGTLNGLPNPFTNPTTGLPVQNNTGSLTYKTEDLLIHPSELSILVNKTIISLEQMITSQYGVEVKLIAKSK
jgi:hypothetical protein